MKAMQLPQVFRPPVQVPAKCFQELTSLNKFNEQDLFNIPTKSANTLCNFQVSFGFAQVAVSQTFVFRRGVFGAGAWSYYSGWVSISHWSAGVRLETYTKISVTMKEAVVSIELLARNALFANVTNLRGDALLFRSKVQVAFENMIEWFWGVHIDTEERGKKGEPLLLA
jgi:hypothetical protein